MKITKDFLDANTPEELAEFFLLALGPEKALEIAMGLKRAADLKRATELKRVAELKSSMADVAKMVDQSRPE